MSVIDKCVQKKDKTNKKGFSEKINRLSRDHIDDLAQIEFESGHELYKQRGVTLEDFKADLTLRFDQGHEQFFGFSEDGVLKGYISFKPFFPGHKHCEIYWLAVSRKYQGQGIGLKLSRFIEDYAKEKGFRKIFLYTPKTMKRNQRCYERAGYEFVNEFPDYDGHLENNTAVLYGKML